MGLWTSANITSNIFNQINPIEYPFIPNSLIFVNKKTFPWNSGHGEVQHTIARPSTNVWWRAGFAVLEVSLCTFIKGDDYQVVDRVVVDVVVDMKGIALGHCRSMDFKPFPCRSQTGSTGRAYYPWWTVGTSRCSQRWHLLKNYHCF